MCSYMCASPAYSGDCVNEPFFTSISTVASGTPWFSTTMTSSPFASTRRLMILSSSARCAEADDAVKARATTSVATIVVNEFLFIVMSLTQPAVDGIQLLGRIDSTRLRRAEPLAPYTTFRIGGPADLFYDATSADDLANAVIGAREAGLPYFVLGLGAHILVGDKGFRGVVIRNAARAMRFEADGHVWCETGTVVRDLIAEAVRRGWSGLEHYVGIPSTVGGAVWQNLHFLSPAPERARTMFIEEVFESADLLDERGARHIVGRDYMQFGYDTSVLHSGREIALSVTFRLTPGAVGDTHRI